MSSAQAEAKASSMVVSNTLRAVGQKNGINQYVSPFQNGVDDTKWVLSQDGKPYINPELKYAWNPEDWDKNASSVRTMAST